MNNYNHLIYYKFKRIVLNTQPPYTDEKPKKLAVFPDYVIA